jgi:hypothetical protein
MAIGGTFAKRGAPKALLDRQGLLIHNLEALLQCFFEHFAGVLGGGRDFLKEIHVQLDAKMCEIEASLNTQGDAVEELTLSKVVDCVKKLRNTTALGEDGITSPLLKECFVEACWLHWVILVVWRSGQALVAWKGALVVPLYKGKGS